MPSCTCRHPQKDTALPTAGTSIWLATPSPPQNNSSQKDHSKQPTEGKIWGILLLELPHFPLERENPVGLASWIDASSGCNPGFRVMLLQPPSQLSVP